jgi:hypothetical protein
MHPDDPWQMDPSKLPQQLELELPGAVMDWLEQESAQTGRSLNELILELIDQGLQERQRTAQPDATDQT